VFSDICSYIKDKCDKFKENNVSVDETIGLLTDRFAKEGEKLPESEKTALNVISLMLPVLDALVTTRREKTFAVHETNINRLQVSVRNNEYVSDSLAQYSRKDNIRVSGVPEVDQEDLVQAIIDIGKAMRVDVKPEHVSDVCMLGKKLPDKKRQIIVRFTNRIVRNKILMACRELKNSEKYKDVFVYEDLTQLRFKLMQMARKCDGVKSMYTRDGKIHCVLRNATDVMVIESSDDLFKLGVENVDYKKLGLSEL
jgi:hypothetical protein